MTELISHPLAATNTEPKLQLPAKNFGVDTKNPYIAGTYGFGALTIAGVAGGIVFRDLPLIAMPLFALAAIAIVMVIVFANLFSTQIKALIRQSREEYLNTQFIPWVKDKYDISVSITNAQKLYSGEVVSLRHNGEIIYAALMKSGSNELYLENVLDSNRFVARTNRNSIDNGADTGYFAAAGVHTTDNNSRYSLDAHSKHGDGSFTEGNSYTDGGNGDHSPSSSSDSGGDSGGGDGGGGGD